MMTDTTATNDAVKPQVSFDDFVKLDIRTGIVTEAAVVPKSKKLLKLTVFFGEKLGRRTILAGIAGSYDPMTVINQEIVAILNLPPRQLMGEVSEGMLLACADSSGGVRLVQCHDVPHGSELG